MATSQNKGLSDDLVRSIELTTTLMQSLLNDFRENSTALAIVKEKLEHVTSNVDSLSKLVRNGGGPNSMVTRLALVEKTVAGLEKSLISTDEQFHKVALDEKRRSSEEAAEAEDFKHKKALAVLKLLASILPGAGALVMVIIKMFM